MKQIARRRIWTCLIAGLVLIIAIPALALYPQLSTTLSGPAIDGVVPQGDAKVDQSRLPSQPGALRIRVRNINLPNGTVLRINFGGRFAGDGTDIGRLVLFGGQAEAAITMPFEVGRTDLITLMNGAAIVLTGGGPWKV